MSEFKAPFQLTCPIHGEPLVLQPLFLPDHDEASEWEFRCPYDKCVHTPKRSTPLAAFVAALRVGSFLIPASVEPPSSSNRIWRYEGPQGNRWVFGQMEHRGNYGYQLTPDEQADEARLIKWVEERTG